MWGKSTAQAGESSGRLTSVRSHLPRGTFSSLARHTQPYLVLCCWLQSNEVVAVRLRSQGQGLFLAT